MISVFEFRPSDPEPGFLEFQVQNEDPRSYDATCVALGENFAVLGEGRGVVVMNLTTYEQQVLLHDMEMPSKAGLRYRGVRKVRIYLAVEIDVFFCSAYKSSVPIFCLQLVEDRGIRFRCLRSLQTAQVTSSPAMRSLSTVAPSPSTRTTGSSTPAS